MKTFFEQTGDVRDLTMALNKSIVEPLTIMSKASPSASIETKLTQVETAVLEITAVVDGKIEPTKGPGCV